MCTSHVVGGGTWRCAVTLHLQIAPATHPQPIIPLPFPTLPPALLSCSAVQTLQRGLWEDSVRVMVCLYACVHGYVYMYGRNNHDF